MIIIYNVIFWLNRLRSKRILNYDYQNYWEQRALTMKKKWKQNALYDLQEKSIIETINQLNFKTVLELGCGFGRITEIILREKNKIDRYLAVDLSKNQLEHVKNNFASVETFCASIQNLKNIGKFDLVIAVDFLMHMKPEDIENVMKLMFDSHNNHIVNVDYFPKPEFALQKLAPHNFLHDYPKLYEKFGLNPKRNQFSNLQALFYTIS